MIGLIAAIAAISIAGVGFGHSIPLFSVLLDRAGATGFQNGAATAAGAVAVVLATPFYPRVIARMGLKRFLLLSVAVMVLAYACVFAVRETIWAWYPLRFVFSMGASGMFVGSEIWINGAATRESRGRLIGLYSTCLALGFATGPLLLERTGYDGAMPFVVGSLVFASAALPILLARAPAAEPGGESDVHILPLLRRAPATFGASGVFGAAESTLLVFLPLLVLAAGYGEAVSAQVVAVYGFGLVAFQYGVGRAADRFGIPRVLWMCAAAAAGVCALLPLATGALATLYPMVFLLGGFVAGISTAGLILLGDRFDGPRLAAASTGYATAWGLGAAIGPILGGVSKDLSGFSVMIGSVALVLAAYALTAFWRRGAAYP